MSQLSAGPGVPGVGPAPLPVSFTPCTSTPVLISEQQVVFSTAAARRTPMHRRWRVTTLIAAFRRLRVLPEPRPCYPRREPDYLEWARMSREMDRL